MPKNIVVFSDGTGQDGGVRPEQRMSNVYKLYRASHNHPDSAVNPREQVSFYDPGLGTDIGSTALTAPVRFVQKLLGSVVGQGIKRNIADCYEFIINHYQPGDRIFLIGFSRGAYTVRCVANLLMLCGVPTKTPSSDLMRFRKPVRDIAKEAVDTVLEHGAGFPREKYEAERLEMARRFQVKYGSGDGSDANVAPYFIGVFDTVASLGATGMRRLLIQIGLTVGVAIGIALLAIIPALILSGPFHWMFGFRYWLTFFILVAAGAVGGTVWWWHSQKAAELKVIRDFPKPGDVSKHYAEWKGDNFDRLLSRHVSYARSANAIDETRKDFDRVAWGGVQHGVPEEVHGITRLVQWWFAGNHSDVGGSYREAESRLSDIALAWMAEQATHVPDGLKTGPIIIHQHGKEPLQLANTGKDGPPLNIYPAADGVQHCEIAGTHDTLEDYAALLPSWCPNFVRQKILSLNWPVKIRDIKPDAPMHPTVRERFALPEVVQCAGFGKYRPEALKDHDDFNGRIRIFLRDRKALLVHFSTPMSGRDDLLFPADMRTAMGLVGRPLSFSTILSTDVGPYQTAIPPGEANAGGSIGILVDIPYNSAVLTVGPNDDGTSYDPTSGEWNSGGFPPTAENCARSLDARTTSNEWFVKNYRTIGMFVFGPMQVRRRIADDVIVECPIELDEVLALFPDQRFFSPHDGRFLEFDRPSHKWNPIEYDEIIPP